MVGAALAALLACARKNWQVTLIEAFPFPARDSHAEPDAEPVYQPSFDARSTAIAAGSVQLFEQAGVWSQLKQHATAINQVHVSDKGHIGGTVIDKNDLGEAALGYVIPNAWIGNVLLNHIQQQGNIEIIAPAQVKRLQPKQRGAALTIENKGAEKEGESFTLDCELAVIADGAHSPLRQQLGIDVDVHDYQQTAIIANVAFDQPHKGIAYERFTDQGPMALLPLGESEQGCESALVWTQPQDQAERILALREAEFLAELQQRFGFRVGNFTKVGKRDSYPLQLLIAKEQVRSAIAVMGNAAHFLHPVAGQGFNLALRDCAALVAELAAAFDQGLPLGNLDSLLRYQQAQENDQLATIRGSDTLTKLFSSDQLPQAALRALGFIGLEALPVSKQWLSMQSMGQAGKRVNLS